MTRAQTYNLSGRIDAAPLEVPVRPKGSGTWALKSVPIAVYPGETRRDAAAFGAALLASYDAHAIAERDRPTADGSHERYSVPVDHLPDGRPIMPNVCHGGQGCYSAYLHLHNYIGLTTYGSAADRAATARLVAELNDRKGRVAPADDTYVAAVAPKARKAPVKVPPAATTATYDPNAPHPLPDPVVPHDALAPVLDALNLCNACDMRPADPDSAAGYCTECEQAAHAPEPAPVDLRTVRRGPDDAIVDMVAGPGFILPRAMVSNDGPELAESIAARLTIVPTTGRPSCERCGQSFRRSGAGLAWHLANRPDCAARRVSIAS